MTRTRNDPRISICTLAEYAIASPARRRSILRDQRYPSAFIAAPFRDAYAAATDVLLHDCDLRLIDEYLSEWRSRKPRTRFTDKASRLCVEAMTAFRALVATGTFDGMRFLPGRREAYVPFAGVEVSVRPDALIAGAKPGAVKLYIGKSVPLAEDAKHKFGSASYAGTLLHCWLESLFIDAAADDCLIVDVFARRVYRAPGRYVTRRRDLEAACQEIAAVWSAIPEPPGWAEAVAAGA
ncbi:MAG: hypothetical protein K8W52_43630 [Deltaproteobacteria bacterium]|nr:hypothetical protein [Deltaproteobacteria bacterium]